MAYELEYPWRRNPRILATYYIGTVNSGDVEDSLEDVAQWMDEALMPLHTVFSFAELTIFPENILDLFMESRAIHHEQCGYAVFVNPNEFIQFVAKVIKIQSPAQVKFVQTEDEAWEFFNKMGIC